MTCIFYAAAQIVAPRIHWLRFTLVPAHYGWTV